MTERMYKTAGRAGWKSGLLLYPAVWGAGILWFWLASSGDDAMGFSFLYLWIGLPVSNLMASFMIGRSSASVFRKMAAALVFGFLYMMAGYLTFSLANMLSYQNTLYPEWTEFLIGTGISAAGMLAGWAILKARGKNDR
ncbi:MAG: hypothetical protein ACI4W2_00495 [Eubacterium sp.]